MVTEQGLHAHVIMIYIKDLKITGENKNKNEYKFKFQGQSKISQCWFDINFDLIEEKFSTSEPDLYKKIFQRRDETKNKNTFKMFVVPIGNVKTCRKQSFTLMPQCLNIVKVHRIVVVSVFWNQPLTVLIKVRLPILYKNI